MTALSALIDSVENPTEWTKSRKRKAYTLFLMEVRDTTKMSELTIPEYHKATKQFNGLPWNCEYVVEHLEWVLEPWARRITTNVQAQQLAAGIKVETVGESLGLA
jgi:hypothetical protein